MSGRGRGERHSRGSGFSLPLWGGGAMGQGWIAEREVAWVCVCLARAGVLC